jgi:hypothetical protein
VITTVAGSGTRGDNGDNGPATSAQLRFPQGVAVDPAGNLYIADYADNRIRKVSNGVITTVAGTGRNGFSGDNGPAIRAELIPAGVAVDAADNIYIADIYNLRIRRVSNGVITTVAGNGTCCPSGDNGPATSSQLVYPTSVVVDSAGNPYITEFSEVRKISNGVITTVAGSGTEGGDNVPATSAELNGPAGIAVSSAGDLYIADKQVHVSAMGYSNFNNRIRKVSKGDHYGRGKRGARF